MEMGSGGQLKRRNCLPLYLNKKPGNCVKLLSTFCYRGHQKRTQMQISFRADIVRLMGYFYPQLWPAQVLLRVTLVPAWHLAGVNSL